MPKRKREEQEFLKNIERLVAGEEISISEDAGEDFRTAMEFSRRLPDLYAGPSPEFKERLKGRLLVKLAQQDAATRERATTHRFWDFLARVMPQSPVWRTATVTLVVLVAVVTVLWRTGMFVGAPGEEAPMLEAAPRGGEQATMSIQAEAEEAAAEAPLVGAAKETPMPSVAMEEVPAPVIELRSTPGEPVVSEYGQEVSFELVFSNTTEETVTATPFPPRVTIVGALALRPARIVPEGAQTVEIGALGNATHSLVWDQRDDAGAQVAPGWFSLYVGSMTVTRGDESVETGFPVALQVFVDYPQGSMERVIEVGTTETVSGVSVTLERVELHSQGITFTAFVSPPDYVAPEIDEDGAALREVDAPAAYVVDGVATPIDYAQLEYLEEGVRLTWGLNQTGLPPAPSDARELTFRVFVFGTWQGPWQFHISLQD